MARKLIVSEVELGGNSRNYESEEVTLEVGFYDFVPVFRIDPAQKPVLLIVSDDSCGRCKKEEITLDAKYDAKYRKYKVPDIVMPRNNMGTFYLQIIKGDPPAAFTNDDGVISRIEMEPNDGKVKLIYDEKKCENIRYGDNFEITLDNKSLHPAKYKLRIYTKDWKTKELLAGEFNLINHDKDVFSEADFSRMIEEIEVVASKVRARFPQEYNQNYCIYAADRYLGCLLEDHNSFYTLNALDQITSNIKFATSNGAILRAEKFKKLGYVKHEITIKKFEIKSLNNDSKKILILNDNESGNIYQSIKNDIKDRIGYHVYYISLIDGFHTMILVVDNCHPCNPTYKIYDQHGLSNSSGELKNISNGHENSKGLNYQAQWLYNWVYTNFGYYPETLTKLWKIQRG